MFMGHKKKENRDIRRKKTGTKCNKTAEKDGYNINKKKFEFCKLSHAKFVLQ